MRKIRVSFSRTEEDYMTLCCKGWWCTGCKERFRCFTLKDEILDIMCLSIEESSYFPLSKYQDQNVETWLGLRLFGMDSCSITVDDEWYCKELLQIK